MMMRAIRTALRTYRNLMYNSDSKQQLTERWAEVRGFTTGLYYADVMSWEKMKKYDKYFMRLWDALKERYDYRGEKI